MLEEKNVSQSKRYHFNINKSWKILVFFAITLVFLFCLVVFTDITKGLTGALHISYLKPSISPTPTDIPTKIDPEKRKKLIREGYF